MATAERHERPQWSDYFLGLAKVVSQRSHDQQTQHGSVLVGKNHEILGTGCNGFPRGMKDDSSLPSTRPAKYPWMRHSERNAIASSRASKLELETATIYVTGPPCFDCLTDIWQNGIRHIVHIDGRGWARDEQEEGLKAEFIRQTNGQLVIEAVKPNFDWLARLIVSDSDIFDM